MSKITELIDKCLFLQYKSDIEQVEEIMKKYAEWYALEYRSKILDECWTDDYGKTLISDTEILSIKLPNHE